MPKESIGSTFCRKSTLGQIERAQVNLLATLAVARIAQSETRGQKLDQRQFRGETKPSKHRFRPPSR